MFVQLFLAKVRAKRRIMLLHFVGAELWLPSQGAACSDAGSAPAEAVRDAGDHRIMRRTFLSDRFATTGKKVDFFLLFSTALEVGGGILRGPRAPLHPQSKRIRCALCLSLGEMATERGGKGNVGNCSPQMTEEMKLSLHKGGCNPPASLLITSGMLQMLAETGQDEFKWWHGSFKALFNPVSPHGSVPEGSRARVGFPTRLILHRVREGGKR